MVVLGVQMFFVCAAGIRSMMGIFQRFRLEIGLKTQTLSKTFSSSILGSFFYLCCADSVVHLLFPNSLLSTQHDVFITFDSAVDTLTKQPHSFVSQTSPTLKPVLDKCNIPIESFSSLFSITSTIRFRAILNNFRLIVIT